MINHLQIALVFCCFLSVLSDTRFNPYHCISEHYQDPIERPPFGLSDHASIELQPRERALVKQPTITIKARDLRPSKRQAMGTYLEAVKHVEKRSRSWNRL